MSSSRKIVPHNRSSTWESSENDDKNHLQRERRKNPEEQMRKSVTLLRRGCSVVTMCSRSNNRSRTEWMLPFPLHHYVHGNHSSQSSLSRESHRWSPTDSKTLRSKGEMKTLIQWMQSTLSRSIHLDKRGMVGRRNLKNIQTYFLLGLLLLLFCLFQNYEN